MMRECIDELKIELFERQSQIINLQSEIIDDLFRTLSMHISAEELDKLPVLKKINEAAQIRAENSL